MSRLITVFDYSGTLSLEAVAFARNDSLKEQLRLSGLAEFGASTPEAFWNGIVNPTWEEGSRTVIGYRRLLVGKISEDWAVSRKKASLIALDRAAGLFVGQYFSQSRIDPSWRPLLREIYDHPLIKAIVATDHYAEATAAIKGHFQDMEMKALPLSTGGGVNVGNGIAGNAEAGGCFYIANSADLGYRKDEEEFWVQVRERTNWAPADRLFLVDDFGANEAAGDHYGQATKVAARRQRTTDLLNKVFEGSVEVLPFILSDDETLRNGEARLRIGQIAARIKESLGEGGRPHV